MENGVSACVEIVSAGHSTVVYAAEAVVELSYCLSVSTLSGRLTGPQLFPIVLAVLLVVAAVTVAVRMLASDQRRTKYRYYRTVGVLAGSGGVLVSLRIALDSPASITAFVLGVTGATLCYVAVLPQPFHRARQPLSSQAVAVVSLLWIAGALVVGGTAAGDARHQVWGGIFGAGVSIVSLGVRRSYRGRDNNESAYRYAITALAGAFLFPVFLTVLFSEELAFVSYLVAVVLSIILWWFRRLTVAQR